MQLNKIDRIIALSAISISLILLLMFVLERTAQASPTVTFTVNTTLDEIDDNVGNGLCHTATNHCSLRAAVMEANNGSGATIVVPAGTYTLTLSGYGDLELRKDITLDGAGSNLTIIQGNPAGWTERILRVRNNAKVTVNGVTLRYGHAVNNWGGGIYVVTGTLTLKNSVVESNTADYNGGGIYNNDQLTVTQSSILSNSVGGPFGYYGGGIYNAAGSRVYLTRTLIQSNASWGGVGVYNESGGQVYLNFSTISSNHAITGGGAGVWNNGTADLFYVTVTNNFAADAGGGLYNGIGAHAIIVDPFILHNTALDGGGIYTDMTSTLILAGGSVSSNTATTGPGGGGYNNQHARLTILATDISHNQALDSSYGDGGGIFSYGSLVVEDSNVSNNTGHYGGGISSSGGLTLTTSSVANNSALQGGGLNINGSGSFINQSAISGNTGGGIEADGDFTDHIVIDNSAIDSNTNTYGGGAGIRNGAQLYLTNDTLSDNQTQGSGGGIYNVTGVINVLNNVTIAHNTADSNHDGVGDGGGLYNEAGRFVQFYNTLIAGNVDTGGQAPDCGGELTSRDYNLIQSTLGCTITGTTTHNITGKNPLLGPLQNNGGSTWTRALLPGSPAIDAGNPDTVNWACATSDQRGVARPIGPRCDIGAFEAPISRYVFLPLVLKNH